MKNTAFFFLLFSFFLQAKVIEVGINKPLKSIKKAIALAKVNDTVLVYKGIYKEGNIIINKKITFLGRGYPTLDGQKKYEVLSIKADGVIV